MGDSPITTLDQCNLHAVILCAEPDELLTINHDGAIDQQGSLRYTLLLNNTEGYIVGSVTVSGQLLRNAMGIINSYEQSLFTEVQRG